MLSNYTFNFWLSLFVFAAHIIANLMVTKPNVELFTRLEKLTLFPPGWVFGIWFVIWILQSILFYKTYGSEFWSNSVTLLFILVCVGNLGSQYAGANNLGWLIYILLISCMLVCSVLFMEKTSSFYAMFSIAKSATQLYVGWASLAFLVGTGVILVTDQQVVSDKLYTMIGSIILVIVPIVIWSLWFKDKGDYRMVTIPYFLLYFAFTLRVMLRH
ncbi:tryptophan-rich sensory protein [Runella slithyformis]|uniref:Tryptophan-rich sensory protein n=1 Tax=Runella slithyformis (strain ATCC 29530 / DSM 19594 / LMG 11500 / NCIMB 11436 / LSU 4) TaxID=761193 RepID=A0A7U3ZJB7_RUNSL|nr:tryptophan-rich sensory protein [Runella slithyformis]AEI48248.1 hypothetical protein Runsl_1824 [Runella slithyformis DSM 19594]